MDLSDDSDDEEILLLAGMWVLLDDGPSRQNRPRMGREVLPRKPKEDSMWGRHLRKSDDIQGEIAQPQPRCLPQAACSF
jgi:hypothetical protein